MVSQKHGLDSSQSLLGIRILLVEDEPDIAALLMFILEAAGAEVTTLKYAEIALKQLESRCPDVLLCDVKLPFADGCWLIRQIRTHEYAALRELPAIAITSYPRDVSEYEALKAGFDRFLVKFESSIGDNILYLLSNYRR